ncbi:hypothetical protein [Rhizobium sp. SYY.PMSO]|uniref:hypothetical protein n=1 Tax=Rhizobium sp. SYY.PMSO TaxID=3382192 RepID=UPI0039901191
MAAAPIFLRSCICLPNAGGPVDRVTTRHRPPVNLSWEFTQAIGAVASEIVAASPRGNPPSRNAGNSGAMHAVPAPHAAVFCGERSEKYPLWTNHFRPLSKAKSPLHSRISNDLRGLVIVSYDWSGARTRRIKAIKMAVSVAIVVAVLGTPTMLWLNGSF